MTPQQHKTLAKLREEDVAFPPIWESGQGPGAVIVMRVVSYSGGQPPRSIEVELVTILADGQSLNHSLHDYVVTRKSR